MTGNHFDREKKKQERHSQTEGLDKSSTDFSGEILSRDNIKKIERSWRDFIL